MHIVLIVSKNGMAIYYFGYGSNLSSAMMREWCPEHRLVGKAHLRDWALAFTRFSERWQAGVADIIQQTGAQVWGALYAVSTSDLEALDRKESNGVYYQRIACTAYIDQQLYDAFTYVVIDKALDGIPISTAYRDTMLTGARELNLPTDYIAHIVNLPLQDA
ncbi:MAG: gamma-glutamylcyclotransferase family protein [Anaerolineae bacterium]